MLILLEELLVWALWTGVGWCNPLLLGHRLALPACPRGGCFAKSARSDGWWPREIVYLVLGLRHQLQHLRRIRSRCVAGEVLADVGCGLPVNRPLMFCKRRQL